MSIVGQVPDDSGNASLGFANTWGIILEQFGHGLLESAIVFAGILLDVERLRRRSAPCELLRSWVE